MKKMSFVFLGLLLILSVLAGSCHSGVSNIPSPTIRPTPTTPWQLEMEWSKTFGGPGPDVAHSVQQTSDGGYIIAGETTSYGAGSFDVWVVKTNTSGEEQWSKTFGGGGPEVATSVQQTSDGGYIITGCTKSYGALEEDAWVIKTDANGEEQWSKAFGGPGREVAHCVQQTSDGGYIIAGDTETLGAEDSYAWLVKTDANGEEQWSKTFGGFDKYTAQSVQQTSDGGYIITGSDTPLYAREGDIWYADDDIWLVKTDANGEELWSKTFFGFDKDTANSVQQTSDGGYIITGSTASYGAGDVDIWIVKTDANGEEQWNKTFGGSGGDAASSVQQTSDGGYIVAGFTTSYGAGGMDIWIVKTDAGGEEQWSKTFGGSGDETANSIQQTFDGGYIIAGFTTSYGAGSFDVWVIKLRLRST